MGDPGGAGVVDETVVVETGCGVVGNCNRYRDKKNKLSSFHKLSPRWLALFCVFSKITEALYR